MMIRVLFCVLGLTSLTAMAIADDETPTVCKRVRTLAEARSCVLKQNFAPGEIENSIGVTTKRKAYDAMYSVLTGRNSETYLEGTDLFHAHHILDDEKVVFLAVVMQHFDEDQVTYLAIEKGNNVYPGEIVKLNVANLDPYPRSVEPLDWALGLRNIKGWHYDLFEDLSAQ